MKSTRIPMFILVFSVLTIVCLRLRPPREKSSGAFTGTPTFQSTRDAPRSARRRGRIPLACAQRRDWYGEAMISSLPAGFRNRFVEVRSRPGGNPRRAGRTEERQFPRVQAGLPDSKPHLVCRLFRASSGEHFRWEQTGVRKVLKVNFGKNG